MNGLFPEKGRKMGQRKREMKKIGDVTSRQVTFSKRRAGLLTKAKELSILCDATVALVIFSSTGKLYECSRSSMQRIIERYLMYPKEVDSFISFIQRTNVNNIEWVKMKDRYENISRVCRQMNGKELESIELKELEGLEDGLEGGLKCIRSRKAKHDEMLMMQMDEHTQKVIIEMQQLEEKSKLHAQLIQDSQRQTTAFIKERTGQDNETSLQLRL